MLSNASPGNPVMSGVSEESEAQVGDGYHRCQAQFCSTILDTPGRCRRHNRGAFN